MYLRLATAAAVLALVWLQYQFLGSPRGVARVWQLEQAVATQRADNAALRARNAQIDAENDDLRSGVEAIEERARAELGMVGPDEVFYQIVDVGDESVPPSS